MFRWRSRISLLDSGTMTGENVIELGQSRPYIRHSCESRNLLNSLADSQCPVFKCVMFSRRSRISLHDSGTTAVENVIELGQSRPYIRHSCESRNLLNSLADSQRPVFKCVMFSRRSRISLRDSGTTAGENVIELGHPHPYIRHSCESRDLLNNLADSQRPVFKCVMFSRRSRISLRDSGTTAGENVIELGQSRPYIRHSCESRNLLNSLADLQRPVIKCVMFSRRSRISLRDSGTTAGKECH